MRMRCSSSTRSSSAAAVAASGMQLGTAVLRPPVAQGARRKRRRPPVVAALSSRHGSSHHGSSDRHAFQRHRRRRVCCADAQRELALRVLRQLNWTEHEGMGNKARWGLPLTESTVESAALPRAAALVSFAAFVAVEPRGRAAYTGHCGRYSSGGRYGTAQRHLAVCVAVLCCFVLGSGSCGSRSLPDRSSSRPSHRPCSRPATSPCVAHRSGNAAHHASVATSAANTGSLSSGAVGRRGRVGAPRRHWGHEARHRCSRRSGSSSSRRRRRTLYGPAVLPTASTLWRPPLVLPSTLCTSAVQYPPVWFHTLPSSAQRSRGRRTWRPTTCYLRRAISSRHR